MPLPSNIDRLSDEPLRLFIPDSRQITPYGQYPSLWYAGRLIVLAGEYAFFAVAFALVGEL